MQPYPLDRPLPADVFPPNWRGGATYLNYPVFSKLWYVRRLRTYLPMGIFFGAIFALRTAAGTRNWSLAAEDALLTIPLWIGIFNLGAGLCTIIREQNYSAQRERRLILLAIAVATVLALMGWNWSNQRFEHQASPGLTAHDHVDEANWALRINDFLSVTVVVAASGSISVWLYISELRRWNAQKAARELQLARAQRDDADRKLAVLQAQIEPHFLYNTLASVRSLLRTDVKRAEATIDALVDHLRLTLPKIRDEDTLAPSTLRDQIEICRSYLDVMRVRMGERLSYSIDVSEDAKALAFPPLMLLPLVENAIKHGVEPKPGPCSIIIRAAKSSAQFLEVEVTDDGAGLREGPSDGVGLANIRAQLATRFDARGVLDMRSRAAGGTSAVIRIPIEVA